jgi:cytochrome c oxidase subunit 4
MSTHTHESAEHTESKGREFEPHHQTHEHEHPSDRKYVIIALILGVITAAEVMTYFWEDASTTALILILFPMMIAKFAIVCGYFMHLKFDNPIFRRIFIAGLVLAVVVYLVALSAFEFFSDDYFKFLKES